MLLEAVRDFCSALGYDKTYWLAFSGGLDSRVLLSLLHTLRLTHPIKLHAIHIHHGLSSQADTWAAFCEQICEAHQIEYVSHAISVTPAAGESLEAVARGARYAVLANYIGKDDVLLTAHHQDDQAETVLLQLLRGAGIQGLAAMPALKSFSDGQLGRPLLPFSRTALSDYAKQHQLGWVEDESNQCVKLSRNWIRHEMMPLLKQYWPGAEKTLARSARHCGESKALLQEYGLSDCFNMSGSRKGTLSVARLIQLSPERQRHVLRTWVQSMGYGVPETKKLMAIQRDVLLAAWDAMPCVNWGNVTLRRYRDDLYLMPRQDDAPLLKPLDWNFSTPLKLEGIGELHALSAIGQGVRAEVGQVSVRARTSGEWVRLAGRSGRRSLKQLFQEWGVPPWERNRVPLLFIKDQLISILGYFLDENYTAKAGEQGWTISLLPLPLAGEE